MTDRSATHAPKQPSPRADLIATVSICVAGPLIAAVFWVVEWRWIWLGALAWTGGLLVKIPADALIDGSLRRRSAAARAIASGLVSAIAELGVAAAIFMNVRPPVRPLNAILTFAAAAGVTEVVALLAYIPFQRPDPRTVESWTSHARASRLIRYQTLVERVIALVGHVGARGFFILAIHARLWPLLPLPILTFGSTDGLATYGFHAGWDWCDPERTRRFFGTCAGVAAAELVMLTIFVCVIA